MAGYYLSAGLVHLYNQCRGRCYICGEFVPIEQATREHVIPRASIKSGVSVDREKNVLLAHSKCNHKKGDQLDVVYISRGTDHDTRMVRTKYQTSSVPRWRCTFCGAINRSEDKTVVTEDYMRTIRFCFNCVNGTVVETKRK